MNVYKDVLFEDSNFRCHYAPLFVVRENQVVVYCSTKDETPVNKVLEFSPDEIYNLRTKKGQSIIWR